MSEERHPPDYDLQDYLEFHTPDQFKALGHPVRYRLLGLLLQRAATISQLAEALGELKGNISHHLKVLEQAGMVRLVGTRRVQGGTERYWGRTAWMLGAQRRRGGHRPDAAAGRWRDTPASPRRPRRPRDAAQPAVGRPGRGAHQAPGRAGQRIRRRRHPRRTDLRLAAWPVPYRRA